MRKKCVMVSTMTVMTWWMMVSSPLFMRMPMATDTAMKKVLCKVVMRPVAMFPTAPIAMGGTLSGDPYQIPTALVDLTLRELGWNATSLGCELPVESFLKAALDYQPTLIWLSVSAYADLEQFIADENRLVDGLPPETAVVVGGRGIIESALDRLQYSAICSELSELIDFAHILVSSKSA